MSNQSIKVLFIARPHLFTVRGGDTTQIEKTAKYLKALGVQVHIYDGNHVNYDDFDLIHYFNLIDPEDILGSFLATKTPKVLSTIFLKYDEYDRNYRKGGVGFLSKLFSYNQVEYFKTVAKVILKGEKVSSFWYYILGHGGAMRKILKGVVHILPNSTSELGRLRKEFDNLPEATIVTNAIDSSVFTTYSGEEKKENKVLCVARFEGNKNQINLIEAAKLLDCEVILLGKAAPNQKSYYTECKKIAGPNVVFKDRVSEEELAALYKSAKVHILPSWFETTGLSSLEAAAMGCNVVVTDKGDVREYFGDLAYYCDPASPESIANAITRALAEPVNPELRKLVTENYTWERAAEQTLSAYKKVLNI